ncbi:cell division protein FtsW [Thalassotalea aquiviva]|uniref:cell division protein FtsW n=1 Tax=Thalassotalea aquiviva TaxID=3242415 RepID=UPI003529E39D
MSTVKSELSLPSLPHWLFDYGQKSGTLTFDRTFVLLTLAFYMIGLIMVASSSMPVAERLYNDPFHFVMRHSVYIVLSLITAGIFLQVPMQLWHKYSGWLLLVAVILLVLVLIIGRNINGSTRWIVVGPITIQAAEPAKLFFFCYLCGYLVRRKDEVSKKFKGWIKPVGVLFLLAVLLLFQPDLGTGLVMFATTFGLLFLAGANLGQFLSVLLAGIGAVAVLILTEPYRMRRFTSFLDPWQDPYGSGYQLTQSLMAYGRGEIFGQGLGNSVQKLEYLPEAHTDFVMAVIGEELGFIGVCALLVLCLVLVVKALLLGKRALEKEKHFEGYFAYAIGIWLSFQAAVNVGASAGMIPTKGLTMPLISYGGSSMIIMTLAIVVLIRIDHELRLQTIQAVAKGSKK